MTDELWVLIHIGNDPACIPDPGSRSLRWPFAHHYSLTHTPPSRHSNARFPLQFAADFTATYRNVVFHAMRRVTMTSRNWRQRAASLSSWSVAELNDVFNLSLPVRRHHSRVLSHSNFLCAAFFCSIFRYSSHSRLLIRYRRRISRPIRITYLWTTVHWVEYLQENVL